jgi:Lrp/AsnC family transcriptional regulator, leucine-responsive regulatory protein
VKKIKDLELDAIDRRLLDILQDDCALTNQALAERVHISPPTCLRRVKRLAEDGVIERRIAILAPDRLPGLTALVELTLDQQGAEHMARFEARVAGEPDIQQCYRVASGVDFVLVLRVADMDAYHALVHRLFTAAENVRNLRVFFAVKRSKFEPRVALPPMPSSTP